MDKILDRLGIFDLVAVFLPGVIATGLSLVMDDAVFNTGFSAYVSPDELVIFLIISYLVGTIFQELGSLIYKYFVNRNDVLLSHALNVERKNCTLTKEEKYAVQRIVQKELRLEEVPDDTQLFHFCRYSGGSTAHSDKEQSLAAMSMNLSLYFFLLASYAGVWSVSHQERACWYAVVIAMLVGVLFFARSARYYSVRFVRVVRTYYYSYIQKAKQ